MDGTMNKLYEMICAELEEIAEKPELSAGDLDVAHKLVVTKEKMLRIEELEGNLGYSGDGEWTATGSYGRGYSRNRGMMGGNSYARSRDARGRYSSRGYSRTGYSMAEGRGMMAEQLQEMLADETLTPQERQALQRAAEAMR